MGKPSPGCDVRIIDLDGNECPPDEPGDIALSGRIPPLFKEYWKQPDETEAVFRDGYYLTGDRAYRDEDGYLWFVGRSDDVILSAGYRIGPFEVESVLIEHPAVVESAMVPSPDEDRGSVVKAYVVLGADYEPSDGLAREIQDFCRAQTAPYKYLVVSSSSPSYPRRRAARSGASSLGNARRCDRGFGHRPSGTSFSGLNRVSAPPPRCGNLMPMTDLRALDNEQYCYLTTTGRVTGRPHEIEIWYALEGATLYMLSDSDCSDWVKNLRRTPEVTVRIAGETFDGRARVAVDLALP